MKFFFICGSLEPGKDGVGDYTRRLAAELIKKRWQCTAISINDAYVSKIEQGLQKEEEIELDVLRLPATLSWSNRIEKINEIIKLFSPQIISLQYVPYAFHSKGLPLNLAGLLKGLHGKHRWHIMFHELWVGKEDGAALKMLVTSLLQKYIITNTIRRLNPTIVHTHLPAYKINLSKIGCSAKELPLFSNIRQVVSASPYLFEKMEWNVAFFSQVDTGPAMLQFLTALQEQVTIAGKKLRILLLGGTKVRMENFKNAISILKADSTVIEYCGFLNPIQLSEKLGTCVLGITPVIEKGLGKSGTVAAFLEHGLPVGVPFRDGDEPPFFYKELNAALVFFPTLDNLINAAREALTAKKLISVEAITQKLITDVS